MKFYPGQPIVCINDAWIKEPRVPLIRPSTVYPVLGKKYTAGKYLEHNGGRRWHVYVFPNPMLSLREIGDTDVYDETHFAPVTDQQVRDIVEEAHKLGPWTGGVHWHEKEDAT